MKIFITEDKKDEMSELCEKMLHYGGKLMSCLEALDEEDSMGMRGRMGMRDDYDDDDDMGMRRGRSRRTGRYTSYRY